MKRYNKRNFTLIEIMFVVGILVILIGISWVAGNKVLRKQAESHTRAELKLLHEAVKQYQTRWGNLPHFSQITTSDVDNANGLDFAEYLSKVSPHSTTWTTDKPRPMYIDYSSENFNVNYTNYALTYGDGANVGIKLSDPYEQTYHYVIKANGEGFYLYSVGLDSIAGTADDIRSDQLNQ